MTIFSLVTLIGGLAFFLYGMNVMSTGLERMAGGKLESYMTKMTSGKLRALTLGAVVTAAIQSSSAVTVMLVGLVNSGIMTLGESIGVIMGSNIGTTITAWILTLSGIESDNVIVRMLKPENFSLIFAFVGVLFIMAAKSAKKKDVGNILVGFAVLMFGMKLMSQAMAPLSDEPGFAELMTAFENPILGVLAGLLITAVIQSSAASVGMLQALSLTGGVTFGAALPIIMGQNIGTCVTALLSCFGVGRNAKRVAVLHVSFNMIGTAVCLVLYCTANALFELPLVHESIDTVGIAAIHSAFNLFTTALLLPFTDALERLAVRFLPDKAVPEPEHSFLLDRRLLATPSVAISECDNLTEDMCAIAIETVRLALDVCAVYDAEAAERILRNENTLDRYEDELGTSLVLLSAKPLSEGDSLKVSKMLHAIGDFERMGDHAVNLLDSARELHEKGLSFSEAAKHELAVLSDAVREILSLTSLTYTAADPETAMRVEPLEQTIDALVKSIRNGHIARLQKGECSIELGFVLSDILGNLERVSDHCSNIAVAVIELAHSSFDTHRYLGLVRADNELYREAYESYTRKYDLLTT